MSFRGASKTRISDVQLHIGESQDSGSGPSDHPGMTQFSLQMRHRRDAVGVHLATLVDRDIFLGYEAFIREVKSDLVRRAGVVERPSATTMNEMTVVIFLVRPQSRDPACLAMLAPERRIDPVVFIERRDDDIGETGIAFGVTWLAGKLDADPVSYTHLR